MAKTRKKIQRIAFDDLAPGMAIRVMWRSGDVWETVAGAFVEFRKVDREWFLVLRVVSKTPSGAWESGLVEVSTRANLEAWPE